MRGFFSSRFGWSLLERLVYIRERGRKMRIPWDCEGRERGCQGKRKVAGKKRVGKSKNTKTSGDFLTKRKCFHVCLLWTPS